MLALKEASGAAMAGSGNRKQRSTPEAAHRAAVTGAGGAFSTVSHSAGSCAMVSGVLPFAAIFFFFHALNVQRFGAAAGAGTGADTIAADCGCGFDFIKAAIQLSRPLPQPSSVLIAWPSQPGLPGGTRAARGNGRHGP